MRTFIALEISDEIKSALDQIESRLKYAGADVKWVRPDIHLTVKFLGEISEGKAGEVASALDRVAASTKPFALTIKDIGAFPKLEFPRVIWAGLEKGAAESKALAVRVDEELARIGFAPETRPFSPHLTIGRVRSPLNKDKLREKMSAYSVPLMDHAPQLIASIILFQSTLTPQGPIYTKVHEAKLIG